MLSLPLFLTFCCLEFRCEVGSWSSNFGPRYGNILQSLGEKDRKILDPLPPNLEAAMSALNCLVHVLLLGLSVRAAEAILTRKLLHPQKICVLHGNASNMQKLMCCLS